MSASPLVFNLIFNLFVLALAAIVLGTVHDAPKNLRIGLWLALIFAAFYLGVR